MPDKKYYNAESIRVLGEVRKKLIDIIKPFIPDCMNYKIGENK